MFSQDKLHGLNRKNQWQTAPEGYFSVFLFYLPQKEFWKVVNDRETYVSVHRGTLDTNQEHSCFPTDKGDTYSK